jgi:hypothetical protein
LGHTRLCRTFPHAHGDDGNVRYGMKKHIVRRTSSCAGLVDQGLKVRNVDLADAII